MWRRTLTLLFCLSLLLALPLAAGAQADDPVASALRWLATRQQADGGFSNGFAPASDPGTTADAVVAIISGGQDPTTWRVGGRSPLDFLASAVETGALAGPGQAAKVALAVTASGGDPRAFAGVDLTGLILDGYDQATGFFGMGPFDSALALLALAHAGQEPPAGALEGLLAARLEDGSYAWNGDTTPGAGDSNTTALVVQALAALGAEEEIAPSLDYFRAVQNEDGGWTYQKPSEFGEDTDANSTALVIQALLAAGEDLADWGDPQAALLALQQPSGAFAFNAATPGDNILATIQAIPALAGVDLAHLPRGVPAAPAQTGGATMDGTLVIVTLIAVVILLAVTAWAGSRQARPE